MASAKRTNLISLMGLLLLVTIVAITPDARQMAARVADWIEGVKQERAEFRKYPKEQQARQKAQAEETPFTEAAAEPPAHTTRDEDGLYQPEPGYWWIDNDPANLAVEWRPGSLHPDDPRVIATSQPDQWAPAPGYDWIEEKGVDDLRVAWKPGKPHAIFGHVLAGNKEGEWTPAPGFNWANDDPNDLTVVPADGGS
jgi:Sec-independent protein translocase protein TatA